MVHSCPSELTEFLLQQFELPDTALIQGQWPCEPGPSQPIDRPERRTALRFAPHEGRWPEGRLRANAASSSACAKATCCATILSRSFEPVVAFLREAVNDPEVLAIKQTIYRTGSESPLMDLLIDAARVARK